MNPRTENFNIFSDPKLRCTCGHAKCDKRAIKQSVLDMVQLMREDADRAFTVTSGGRCNYHPKEIHRTTPADHQNCVALDISCANGVERMELVTLALKHGFNAIGVAKSFVHCGVREGATPVMWVY